MEIKSIVMLNHDMFDGYQLVDFPNGNGEYDTLLFDTRDEAKEYLKEEGYILFATLQGDEIYYQKADGEKQ